MTTQLGHMLSVYKGPWMLNLDMHVVELSASRLCRFIPKEIAPGIGAWVGPKIGLNYKTYNFIHVNNSDVIMGIELSVV
jgi:hypothetical protein